MRPRKIEIHIEEIVLHGVDASDRRAVGEGIRAELARLLGEGEIPAALREGGAMDARRAEFTAAPGARGAAFGAGVAGAVHRGLSR